MERVEEKRDNSNLIDKIT